MVIQLVPTGRPSASRLAVPSTHPGIPPPVVAGTVTRLKGRTEISSVLSTLGRLDTLPSVITSPVPRVVDIAPPRPGVTSLNTPETAPLLP